MSGIWALLNAVTGEDVFLQLSEYFSSLLSFEQFASSNAATMVHYPPGELLRAERLLSSLLQPPIHGSISRGPLRDEGLRVSTTPRPFQMVTVMGNTIVSLLLKHT